jgi:hypothetical protein
VRSRPETPWGGIRMYRLCDRIYGPGDFWWCNFSLHCDLTPAIEQHVREGAGRGQPRRGLAQPDAELERQHIPNSFETFLCRTLPCAMRPDARPLLSAGHRGGRFEVVSLAGPRHLVLTHIQPTASPLFSSVTTSMNHELSPICSPLPALLSRDHWLTLRLASSSPCCAAAA